MNEFETVGHPTAGTLLWIGDRHSPEFQAPFRFCESSVAQLALRSDLTDAIQRGATAVRRIVIANRSRQPIDVAAMSEIKHRYADAEVMRLLGTLC